MGRSSSPGGVNNFHFSTSSRPALGSTKPPIQWVRGALSPGLSGRDVKLTTHLQLVERSWKRGSTHPLPYTPSWRCAYLVKYGDNFTFFYHVVQTGSVVHVCFYPVGTEGFFHGSRATRGVTLTTYLQLVPRWRKCGSIRPLPHTTSWSSA
jgi:hypothetical protein